MRRRIIRRRGSIKRGRARGDRRCTARHRDAAHTDVTQAGEHLLQRQRTIEQRQADEQRLENQLRLSAAAKSRLDFRHQLQHSKQVTGAPLRCHAREPFPHRARDRSRITAKDDRQLRAHQVGQAGQQQHQVHTQVRQALDRREDIGSTALADDRQQRQQLIFRHQAQRVAHSLRREARVVTEGEHLIRQRERIAQPSIGGTREHVQCIGVVAHPFVIEHRRQPVADLGGIDAAQVEALQAAEHRRRGLGDLLRLGGGEHEHHARRRLLENLEQRIPRLAGEHVCLVHDVDLVAIAGRGRIHRAFAQIACIVHAAVRRRVDLDHVQRGAATPDACAGAAGAARLAVVTQLAVLAVERHGEHASQRGLTSAARPAEQVAMRHTIARDRTFERVRHVCLHGDLREVLRSVLSGERNHGLGILPGGARVDRNGADHG